MKKVLVGCGVMLLLGILGVGGSALYCGHVVQDVAGDLMVATSSSVNMSLDRMEQDAVDLDGADLGKRMADLRLKPVRVRGKVWLPKDKQGNVPQGLDESAVMFLEPSVMVISVGQDVLPRKRPEGTRMEVVGIAASINLGKAPGMTDEARAQLTAQLGGTDMPVVVVRKVSVLAE